MGGGLNLPWKVGVFDGRSGELGELSVPVPNVAK